MRGAGTSVPAPVGGWNARDSLENMPSEDAPILDNWWPSAGYVELRKGFQSHCAGIGHAKTLAEFHAGTERVFIAAGGGKFWDITTAGAPVELASGFNTDNWQWENFDGKIGFVNGDDAPQQYDGTTWAAMTISGTSLTVSNLVGINKYQSRTYFWERDSQDFWYSATNALGGALTKFPLSRVGQFGGNLMFMATWSRDAGDGMDDLAVFVMTSGDVLVYQGDPGSTFSLVGVYRIGEPVGIRGYVRIGGELYIITRDGITPMSIVVTQGRDAANENPFASKINPAVQGVAQSYASNFGWQAMMYPRANRIVLNLPVDGGTEFHQYVKNTSTGAWSRFTGMNGSTWGTFRNRLYFAKSTGVYLADEGYNDDGQVIECDALTASSYLGSRGRLKQITAVCPVISSNGSVTYSMKISADYQDKRKPYTQSTTQPFGSPWGSSWGSSWFSGEDISRKWKTLFGEGIAIALRFRVASKNKTVKWYSINYLFKRGGVI